MASSVNALLAIRDSLPATLAELQGEREKLVARLRELNEQIVIAETHLAVSPPDAKDGKS